MKDPMTIELSVDMQEELRRFTVVAKLIGKRRALIRLWLACHLLGIASAIIGGGLEVELKIDAEPHG